MADRNTVERQLPGKMTLANGQQDVVAGVFLDGANEFAAFLTQVTDPFRKTRFVAGSAVPGMPVCHGRAGHLVSGASLLLFVEVGYTWKRTEGRPAETSGAEAHYLGVASTTRLKPRPFKTNY